MFEFLARLLKFLYPIYCFYGYYRICDNFLDPISDFAQNKLAVFFTVSFILYYCQKIIKIILKLLLNCTLDEEKTITDVLFLMMEFCVAKNSNFIYDIYLPSKIISFSGSIITALDELIDGFSVKIVLPSISTHVILMLFLFLFFGIHFYFLCYFLINYKKNAEVNSLIFSNLFTILYYTICSIIYHTLFIFDRSNFGCSIQTEYKANLIKNYGGLIYHIFDSIFSLFRIYIIGPNLYTSFHVFLSLAKLYNSYDDFTFYLKVKNIKSELPDATFEDIDRDDTCIICRESMTVGTAKKLPCGHCFHTTCLERWVNKNPACPTCSRDLRKILRKSNIERNEQKDDDNQEENDDNENQEENDNNENQEENDNNENQEENDNNENQEENDNNENQEENDDNENQEENDDNDNVPGNENDINDNTNFENNNNSDENNDDDDENNKDNADFDDNDNSENKNNIKDD